MVVSENQSKGFLAKRYKDTVGWETKGKGCQKGKTGVGRVRGGDGRGRGGEGRRGGGRRGAGEARGERRVGGGKRGEEGKMDVQNGRRGEEEMGREERSDLVSVSVLNEKEGWKK